MPLCIQRCRTDQGYVQPTWYIYNRTNIHLAKRVAIQIKERILDDGEISPCSWRLDRKDVKITDLQKPKQKRF